MATAKKTTKSSSSSKSTKKLPKVKDLSPRKDPKGGDTPHDMKSRPGSG
jgi:hypothetical protein